MSILQQCAAWQAAMPTTLAAAVACTCGIAQLKVLGAPYIARGFASMPVRASLRCGCACHCVRAMCARVRRLLQPCATHTLRLVTPRVLLQDPQDIQHTPVYAACVLERLPVRGRGVEDAQPQPGLR